uniref:Inhibitor of growth protein 2 n=1 Tax=Schistosoma japonicum TaxID=6182 RepID=C1L4Z0_SCHJA|nr:Inhibitor of growth protein 2 [Schistosoma japonicum]
MELEGVDSFISSYVDSLQILPLEMQSRITEYLQSDLQQRHLLALAKQTMGKLQKSSEYNLKRKHLEQLICVLVAIQNICDRRISGLDELDEVIETHSLKLMNAKLKVDAISSQLTHPNTENVPESEVDISDVEVSGHQSNGSFLRRNLTQELNFDKCTANSMPRTRCNDFSLLSKERFPLRAVSTNNRTATRRSLNRWVSGVHRLKPVSSSINAYANISLQSKDDSNNKPTNRTSVNLKQHKVSVAYARYSRTQQQRFKSHRVLSRSLNSNRARPPQYMEYAMLKHGSHRKKSAESKFVNPDYFKNRKEITFIGNVKRRYEHRHSSFYANEDCFDSSTKSVNKLTTEEDKMEERDAYTLLSLKSPKRFGDKPLDWNNSYNGSEDPKDVDCDDSTGHNTCDIGYDQNCAAQETQVIRTLTGQLTKTQNCEPGRQKIYKLRRANNSIQSNQSCHRLNPSIPPASPEYASSRGSVACQSLSHSNARRGCRSNIARYKMDLQSNTRSPPESPPRYGSLTDDVNAFRHKVISGNSPSNSVSEASVSPDERLYCICQKVSFGEMIACDNKFCEVEWFHFSCVDVRVQPKGKWYCPYCRGESSKIKRSDI